MDIRQYQDNDASQWDAFSECCYMATFLHSRRFLSYHRDRFIDASLIIFDGDKWLGVMPAAIAPSSKDIVVSHPGLTYGGIIHQGGLRGQGMIDALELIANYYSSLGIKELIYKAVPSIYHQLPAQDDIYAMFRLGADRVRCDLANSVELSNRLPLSSRRRRSLKKAVRFGVEVLSGEQYAENIWRVLEDNLERKHGAEPVHSLKEILLLHELFPDNIRFIVGCVDGCVEAGVVVFSSKRVFHAQYIASSERGYQTNALDAIFGYCMECAESENAKYFDFGTSNESAGLVLNRGLYTFKSEFGGGGVAHESFSISLGQVG